MFAKDGVSTVALDLQIETLKQIQVGLKRTPFFSIDAFLKILSLLFVCMAFACGALDKNNQWGLLVFFFASSYQLIRIFFYFYGAIKWNSQLQKTPKITDVQALPLISIIVPCYNEEKVIQQSLRSLIDINYPNYEVIVVNDGSTDFTLDILNSMSLPGNVRIISQENSGKATALNKGICAAKGDFVLCVDGDSVVQRDSLLAGIRHFLFDQKVVAVAGSVRVSNKNHLITNYQDLEYSLGDLQKYSLSNLGRVNIIPGPVGLFKKSDLLATGGYELIDTTFAEDTELTLRLINQGGHVVFEPDMVSFTEAPSDWLSLLRQRYRWTRGIYQAFRKNLKSLLDTKKYAFTGYLFLEKVWAPIMEFTLLAYFVGHFVAFANVELFFIYTVMVFTAEIILVALSSYLSQKPFFSHVFTLLIARFSASIVISTWKYLTLLEEWDQIKMTWDKLNREGLVALKTSKVNSSESESLC